MEYVALGLVGRRRIKSLYKQRFVAVRASLFSLQREMLAQSTFRSGRKTRMVVGILRTCQMPALTSDKKRTGLPRDRQKATSGPD